MKSAPVLPENINAYIAGFSSGTQEILQKIRKIIQEAAPEATEAIKYAIPTFVWKGKNLVHFAGYAKHIGFYAPPSGSEAFQKELSMYKTGKGSVQFPLDQPMPWALIQKMVKFRVKELESGKK